MNKLIDWITAKLFYNWEYNYHCKVTLEQNNNIDIPLVDFIAFKMMFDKIEWERKYHYIDSFFSKDGQIHAGYVNLYKKNVMFENIIEFMKFKRFIKSQRVKPTFIHS